jgi:nucleoside-triphosphatase
MLDQYTDLSREQILLIDEIGKMECLSQKFRRLLFVWEKSDALRVFTVAARGTPFIEEFKSRYRSRLLQITPANRDDLLTEVAARLGL